MTRVPTQPLAASTRPTSTIPAQQNAAPEAQDDQQKKVRANRGGNNRKVEVVVSPIIEDQFTLKSSGILKRYKTGVRLGRGGFAECYHLTSLDTGRTYAGKIIPKSTVASEHARKKLHNEIRIHRSVSHKHVVRFERYFDDGDNIVMLLELCPQRTLMELSSSRGALTETEVQVYLWQIIDVVHALHSHCIIHRDLKLGNLFLDGNMNIKLGDFGLATRLGSATERKRTICGTPNYIAPELLTKSSAGHSFEIDVWAIGVIAFTLLFGQPPFQTKSVETTYKKIIDTDYSFPQHTYVSAAAKDFISSILRSAPDARPTLAELRVHPFFTQSPFPEHLPTSVHAQAFPFLHYDHCRAYKRPRDPVSFTAQAMGPFPIIENATNPGASGPLPAPVASAPADRHVEKENGPAAAPVSLPKPALLTKPAKAALPTRPAPLSTHTATPTHLNVANQPSATLKDKLEKPEPRAHPFQAHAPRPAAPATYTYEAAPKQPSSRPQTAVQTQPAPASPVGYDEEVEMLTQGMQRVALNNPAPAAPTPAPAKESLAAEGRERAEMDDDLEGLWVNLWVDYANKYGMGYILSNGSCGIHFNDYSKMVLHANGSDVQYITKNYDGEVPMQTVEHFRMGGDVPPHLTKKSMLLSHFLRYLVHHNKADSPEPGAPDYLAYSSEFDTATATSDPLPHVRSWVRAEHAIVFRLSTRATQFVFFDNTEILINLGTSRVAYTDKQQIRTTYTLDEVFKTARPDLSKRMKYARQLMHTSTNTRPYPRPEHGD